MPNQKQQAAEAMKMFDMLQVDIDKDNALEMIQDDDLMNLSAKMKSEKSMECNSVRQQSQSMVSQSERNASQKEYRSLASSHVVN